MLSRPNPFERSDVVSYELRQVHLVSKSGSWLLWLGALSLCLPTLVQLAQGFWSTEHGGHGPIVLATGIWLLVRARGKIRQVAAPGHPGLAIFLFLSFCMAYVLARMTGMLGIECLAAYGALASVFYYHAGIAAVRLVWFPLIYLLFLFPLPETIVLPLGRVLKMTLSSSAVTLLSALGYSVGQAGVVIYVDHYELLVENACSGMNSLIGLGVIGIFYAYVRYDGSWRASWPLLACVIPIALFSNFVRVLTLILITHYLGDDIAQTYAHDLAAISVFAIAVACLFAMDSLITWLRLRRRQPR